VNVLKESVFAQVCGCELLRLFDFPHVLDHARIQELLRTFKLHELQKLFNLNFDFLFARLERQKQQRTHLRSHFLFSSLQDSVFQLVIRLCELRPLLEQSSAESKQQSGLFWFVHFRDKRRLAELVYGLKGGLVVSELDFRHGFADVALLT
jgi:hypothetical protein